MTSFFEKFFVFCVICGPIAIFIFLSPAKGGEEIGKCQERIVDSDSVHEPSVDDSCAGGIYATDVTTSGKKGRLPQAAETVATK